jgi:hypothetical protein
MTTFGLTTTGLTIPTLEEIRTAINLDLVNAFGGSIDLDTGILARFVGILSERYALLWEALEAVYNSQNPDAAVGFSLDNICAYTGTERLEAVFSTVTLTLTGTPGQIVPAGQQCSTKSNGGVNKFITGQASDPLAALAAWSATTYAIGQRVTSSGKAYQVLAGGAASAPGRRSARPGRPRPAPTAAASSCICTSVTAPRPTTSPGSRCWRARSSASRATSFRSTSRSEAGPA